jgi:hypothetical protein
MGDPFYDQNLSLILLEISDFGLRSEILMVICRHAD